jgi:hypothetical protein
VMMKPNRFADFASSPRCGPDTEQRRPIVLGSVRQLLPRSSQVTHGPGYQQPGLHLPVEHFVNNALGNKRHTRTEKIMVNKLVNKIQKKVLFVNKIIKKEIPHINNCRH